MCTSQIIILAVFFWIQNMYFSDSVTHISPSEDSCWFMCCTTLCTKHNEIFIVYVVFILQPSTWLNSSPKPSVYLQNYLGRWSNTTLRVLFSGTPQISNYFLVKILSVKGGEGYPPYGKNPQSSIWPPPLVHSVYNVHWSVQKYSSLRR